MRKLEQGDGLLGWALRTDAFDAFASRVGVPPESGSIVNDEGRTDTWRTIEAPDDANGAIPFLISYEEEWDGEIDESSHPRGATDICWIEVAVDEERLSVWLGDYDLPIHLASGEDGLKAVALTTPTGELGSAEIPMARNRTSSTKRPRASERPTQPLSLSVNGSNSKRGGKSPRSCDTRLPA